ncbi:hypothetical protein JOC59_001196 [Weissella beninensis]|uniref:Uncharacterized protein n=1 Tax=Periweissella beninensis TaxID=504936 RepID=A0ABT0VHF8_9LACO|nr:hypothetical protein [Periweissella beninensis]MBM7544479.1 hypothetical protein [Periweissella beninensis]MCM2437045.1 hypothetical protein [Periweissella beninensis]
MENIIGYIKFVEEDYIDSFLSLKKLWLSEISVFTKSSEESVGDLINDPSEGKLDSIFLNMPSYITSFTELTTNSFDTNGRLKETIADSIIKSEETLGKNRNFVFIPIENMQLLLTNLNDTQNGERDGVLSHTTIFSRKVCYIDDYQNTMRKLEDDFFAGNVSIDNIAKGFLQTKDEKYKIQNEFRLGIVFPYKKNDYLYSSEPGVELELTPVIPFATLCFKREGLKTLNINQLN